MNAPQQGLQAAFAGLEIPGLPAGPEGVSDWPVSSEPGSGVAGGRVILRREKAHRGGKVVVVVEGFGAQHDAAGIEGLARRLRLACGAGGTVRDRRVEIQGEQVAKVRAFLESEGFQVGGER